jgi:protoporphyrinogen oxidase
VRRDQLGDNFAVMVADKGVLFHRLSKLDFLSPPGATEDAATLMAEVTYRPGDLVDLTPDRQVLDRVIGDLCRLGFISSPAQVEASQLRRFPHAYVIYDLDHRRNMSRVRSYCEEQLGLWLLGRFGEFEYWNMDQVIRRASDRCREILQSWETER